ncbi:unnamed protein product [Rhizophagus irregularis]|nr:unnamed protein product [Rhizophagus irregularis]
MKFFKKSHQGKALLEKYTKDLKIEGGGLKSWVETQWTTMFESADSIWRLKLALEKIPHYLLDPLKKTVLSVEASNTNYADCFIALIRLANAIKQIPVERDLVGFRNYAIDSINRRWESFDNMPFILTYFLHPGYQGEGLKQGMWTKISAYAQDIWKNMGYDINDQEILIAQMLNFKDKQEKTHTDNEVQKMVNESFFFDEVDYNEDNNNEDGYEEIFETQIPNHEVYVLIEDNVDLTNAIFLNNEEEEENEIYN